MARHVQAEASSSKDRVQGLYDYLNSLRGMFAGQAAATFDSAFSDWKQGADQMLGGFDQLDEFLSQAVSTIEVADHQIVGQSR